MSVYKSLAIICKFSHGLSFKRVFAVNRRRKLLAAATLLLAFPNHAVQSPPTPDKFPAQAPVWGYGLTNAFPGIHFNEPTVIATPPGETNAIFVAERAGRILLLTNFARPSVTVFLDITNSTFINHLEMGLLGMAFHPDYKINGRFFVYRTVIGLRDQLSEFRRDENDPSRAVAASEQILISQSDGGNMHNSGCLLFGPDRYLYLTLGDESPLADDIPDSPQAIDKGFFSALIRIDVDNSPDNLAPNAHRAVRGNYRIPRDNPFIGTTEFNGRSLDSTKIRTEFYAVGLRNMWRFTFDPFTGKIIGGDVGAGTLEEIDVLEKGRNYGWPYFEAGMQAQEVEQSISTTFAKPLYQYRHGERKMEGRAIIGGVVYAGQNRQELRGKYVFGDYVSGNIWALNPNISDPEATWLTADRGISTFGVDPASGELLIANLLRGTIERLVYVSPEEAGIPPTLADAGLFSDLSRLAAGRDLIPYTINLPFWSDNAMKRRWILPPGTGAKIGFRSTDPWDFPSGCIWVKHFELELTNGVPESRRRIETRILKKTDTGVYGLTYRWDSATNATLVPPGGMEEEITIQNDGQAIKQLWSYPGWQQCVSCHSAAGGSPLGFNALQLNRPLPRSSTNQLDWLAMRGCFSNPEDIHPQNLGMLANIGDTNSPIQYRARSWLNANCAQCHQPGGFSGADWDARITTPVADAKIIDVPSAFGSGGKIVTFGRPSESYLWWRPAIRDDLLQMPPFGTSVPNDEAIQILGEWIQTLPDPKWQWTNIGIYKIEGSAEQRGNNLIVAGSGEGIALDSVFFLYRDTTNSTQISATLQTNRSSALFPEGGLMFRNDSSQASRYAALFRRGTSLVFMVRAEEGEKATVVQTVDSLDSKLKLVREGATTSAYSSSDGLEWNLIATANCPLNSKLLAGLYSASASSGVVFNNATFDEVSLSSIDLSQPGEGEVFSLPADISLEAVLQSDPDPITRLQLRADGTTIDELVSPPWVGKWTGTREGAGKLQAVLYNAQGSLTSGVVNVILQAPPPVVYAGSPDSQTLGAWPGIYGSEAYLIPGYVSGSGSNVYIKILRGEIVKNESDPDDPLGLVYQGEHRNSEVSDPSFVDVQFQTSDYLFHQAALYFANRTPKPVTNEVRFYSLNGQTLRETQQVIAPSSSIYLPVGFRGTIRAEISSSSMPVLVAGLFCDISAGPKISFLSPTGQSSFPQPVDIPVVVSAQPPQGSLSRVVISDNGEPLQSFSQPPFELVIPNALAGTHLLTAMAWNEYGPTSTNSLSVTVLPPAARVQFLGFDTISKGSWKEHYGSEGFWILCEPPQLGRAVRITSLGDNPAYFDYPSVSPQALQSSLGDFRFAGCYYGLGPWHFDIEVLDAKQHQFGAYFLDWGGAERIQGVEMLDLETGVVLHKLELRDFDSGVYALWRVQGRVRLEITTKKTDSVVSGFFLEPVNAYALWKEQFFTPNDLASFGPGFDHADPDHDGIPNALEFTLNLNPRIVERGPKVSAAPHGTELWVKIVLNTNDDHVVTLFEISEDLRSWRAAEGEMVRITSGGTEERILKIPLPSEAGEFFRVITRWDR